MGAFSGPKTPTDSLIFAYDQDNFKSHPGEPITNIVTNTNLDTGWSKDYGTNINLNDTSVGRPPGVSDDTPVVSFSNNPGVGGNACFWYSYGNYAPQADNTTYYISVWIRTLGQDFTLRAYTADNGETDRKYTTYLTVVGDDTWQRMEWPSITTANPTDSDSLSFQLYETTSVPDFPPEDQIIYLCAPQMTTTRHTGFVDGTRANTGAIIDWVGGNTITATALTYGDGNTFEFDGTDDYFTIADPGYPSAWTDNYSYEAWVRIPTGADWHDQLTFGSNSATVIVGRGSYNGAHGLARRDTNLLSHIVRTDTALYFSDYTATVDTWYHLVGTWDGTTNRLYVNGVEEGTSTPTITGVPDSGNVVVGGNFAFGGNNGGYGEGEIPVARMYNKALSAGEVKQCYHSLKGRFGL